jgi:hypothetical protein
MSTAVVLSIGEQTPWRLTKASSFALLDAICQTQARVLSSSVDGLSQPTHIVMRIQLDEGEVHRFWELLQPYDTGLTSVGPAGGAGAGH